MSLSFPTRAACGVAFAGVLLATGCVDDESTLFIQGVIHRAPPTCVAQADPSSVFLGSGTLDVALSKNYFATFLVGNQFTPRGDKSRMRTETARVQLQGAEVTLTPPGGSASSGGFTVTGSGSVPPNTGADPGWGLFSAVIIPETGLGAAGAGSEIDVHIKVFGVTTGGQDIKSGEFVFPVHICTGCLVDYPLKAITTSTTGVRTCTAAADDTPTATCSFGQDDLVDCRSCIRLPVCSNVP